MARYRAVTVGVVIGMLVLASVDAVAVAESGAGGEIAGDSHLDALSFDGPSLVGFVGATETVDPDTVVLAVALAEDGDAAWTVEYRIRLDDANTTEAFKAYREDIEANTTDYATQFADRLGPTVRTGENMTDREMAVTDASVNLDVVENTGVVDLSVAWDGFGAVQNERLVLDEPFASGFGLDRPVTVQQPERYAVADASPSPDDSDATLRWDAGTDLDGFEVIFERTAGATTDDTSDEMTATSGPGFGSIAAILGISALVAALRK